MREEAGSDRIVCLQEDLASLVGVSTVTLAKCLAALKREGLLLTGYRHVTLTDPDRLAAWMAKRAGD